MTALPADDPPVFMTIDEVSGLLRVSKMKAYRMVEQGELRSIRVGRSIRISRASVKEYLGDLWQE